MRALDVQDVTKRYGSVTALDGVDLVVERGEVVALLGPNGAGKSTLFEVLLGLVRPTSGSVRVLGHPPGGRVRERVGAMAQGAGLPEDLWVREVVALVGRSYPISYPVDEVLARVALTDRARRPVTDLSGGERQRLLLAMALVGAPEVLLLDEPTAALDVESRRTFWAQVDAAAAGGTTVLYATHDVAEAGAVADRVVVLSGGRLVADTTGPGLVTAAGLDPGADERSDLEDAFVALTHRVRS